MGMVIRGSFGPRVPRHTRPVIDPGAPACTPGVSCANCTKLRPFKGNSRTLAESITVPMVEDSVFNNGAPDSTVMVCATDPGERVKLIATTSCTCKTTSGLMLVLKTCFETSM